MSLVALPDRSVRPLIVDEHDATRLGHALLLQRQPWVARCLLARDAREASRLANRYRPDVALLDVSNAGPFVASATAALLDAHAGLRIVLTSRCASRPSEPAERVGAVGFLPPTASATEILASVRAAILTARPRLEIAPAAPGLTDRERRLLELISTGATNQEIAAELRLSAAAVKKNASALYRKLGVRNRTEAAQRAAGLLSVR
jgi:two-component system response regulator DesR